MLTEEARGPVPLWVDLCNSNSTLLAPSMVILSEVIEFESNELNRCFPGDNRVTSPSASCESSQPRRTLDRPFGSSTSQSTSGGYQPTASLTNRSSPMSVGAEW